MSIVVDVDLRHLLGGARDQRCRPTCLAFAASAAHEASRDEREHLSIEFLFFHGVRRSHHDPSRGLTPAVVKEALHQDGQPIETAWPYLTESPDEANWEPPNITDACHKAHVTFTSRTMQEVQDVLRSGRPLILITAVTTAMYTPDASAVVRAGAGDVRTSRSHALLAVGLGHADDGVYVLIRNSWGSVWGDQGHGWFHEAYLGSILVTTGTVS
jgi:hypothetical protein